MKTLLILATAFSLYIGSAYAAAPDLAMFTKCRKVKIFLHPRPTDEELKIMYDKVLPDVPKPDLEFQCRNHIGEMRALLRNGGWDKELSLSERQKAMGDLLNDCCEKKK